MALYQIDYIICPWCNGKTGQQVSHLYEMGNRGKFGPWRCAECQHEFLGTVNAPGDVTVEKAKNIYKYVNSLSLLKFTSVDGPVFFVMARERLVSDNESDAEVQACERYFYEEYSCPTNWLRDCVRVIEDGDTDPHGFLEFVRSVDIPSEFEEQDEDEQIAALFPEAFDGGNH